MNNLNREEMKSFTGDEGLKTQRQNAQFKQDHFIIYHRRKTRVNFYASPWLRG